MTLSAARLASELDFQKEQYRAIEEMLCYSSPMRVSALVRKQDPYGKHDAEWFLPWVRNLAGNKPRQKVEFDEAFWAAYDLCDAFTEGFDTFHFMAVESMKHDLDRLRAVCTDESLRVHTVPYVSAVFSGDRYAVKKAEERRPAAELVGAFEVHKKGVSVRRMEGADVQRV